MIKLIVLDVDGTLTDGKIIYDENGNELKNFNVKDGLAIATWTKKLNKKVGLSLNPDTSIDKIKKFLSSIDLVLIMSVYPGFWGQKFIPKVIDKIKELKNIKEKQNIKFDIEVDGGIDFENSKKSLSISPSTVYSTASFVLLLGVNLSALSVLKSNEERAIVPSIFFINFIWVGIYCML